MQRGISMQVCEHPQQRSHMYCWVHDIQQRLSLPLLGTIKKPPYFVGVVHRPVCRISVRTPALSTLLSLFASLPPSHRLIIDYLILSALSVSLSLPLAFLAVVVALIREKSAPTASGGCALVRLTGREGCAHWRARMEQQEDIVAPGTRHSRGMYFQMFLFR